MPIYDDLDDQGSKADFLKRCRRDFEATKNPLYAWEAWGMVRFTWRSKLHESLPLPEWLAEYFDACGSRLHGWQPERVELAPGHWGRLPEEKPPRRKEGPGSIGRALEFSKGLVRARKEWGGQFDDQEKLALSVVNLMWDQRKSLEKVAQELDEPGRSRPKVTLAVRNAKRGALRRMQGRLREATGSAPPLEDVAEAYRRLCRERAKQASKTAKNRRPRISVG